MILREQQFAQIRLPIAVRNLREQIDLLIVGELSEWETAEYIRDSISSGAKRALIVLGHAVSEEPGMKWMASRLQPQVKPLNVKHVPSLDPFTWV